MFTIENLIEIKRFLVKIVTIYNYIKKKINEKYSSYTNIDNHFINYHM